MERSRSIAAAPIRSASEAWQVICTLLTDTLERSPSVPAGSVRKELEPLNGVGSALIAGGHLESKGLVLVDVDLHLTVRVLSADAALEVEENLSPVPGGGSATEAWTLYLPAAGPLDHAVATAVKKSLHLSIDAPPKFAPAQKSQTPTGSLVDLDALRSLGKKS
jgi:hypothetical protein